MRTHQLLQNTQEWHTYRATHDNASDAPAMMGASPYQTRSELLHARSTGMSRDVDSATQHIFNEGHRYEALARPLAEAIIGEDLYPVVGSEGNLSASFDGLTMAGDIIWEHKSLNESIKAAQSVDDLGAHLRIQMEQQLMISGAEKCLFTASKWDENDQLVEEKHFWYVSDSELREAIVQGWNQFHEDLASYVPREITEKPKADVIMALPALYIQIKGEVTLSNLPDFKAKAEEYIASIKTDLQTDNDFANAEETIKFCDKAEKSLEQSKAAAIGQTASIDELMRTIDNIAEQLRSKRLSLTKLVTTKKDQIKLQILNEAKQVFANHVAKLEAETAPIKLNLNMPDFAGAMKNKRTLASLHDAVDTLQAQSKADANTTAQEYRRKLAWFNTDAGSQHTIFPDLQTVMQKPFDDFCLFVTSRIDQHEKEVAAKFEAARAAEVKAEVKPIVPVFAAPVQVTAEAPTLTLGKMGERLGFLLSAEFLRSIGFEPVLHKGRFAYQESDWQAICVALIDRIEHARHPQQQAA